eukprot:TRINITY_DN4138_c0_g1_i11.p1 TRINITY_DN4138_c0_g1~~TRINITY_DN4138_c0_g1_i11.p1  ORF type:complete len:296 (-),score=43.53 TRINITY_DN4138_c0_g1_i11:161-1018(-)
MLDDNHTSGDIRETSLHMFRCLPCEKLMRKHLDGNKPDPALYELSHGAPCGSVDGFLSHSWSDPPDTKWEIIQAWRANFKAKHGDQEPTVWIDKFCIDQSAINENLRCLPVFLSSCRELIIAAGPTYLSRLWCVMELFVFLEIGMPLDRLVIYGDFDMSAIALFDVMNAECYNKRDKERLLAIIESSFGTTAMFNSVARKVLRRAACKTSILSHDTDVGFDIDGVQIEDAISHERTVASPTVQEQWEKEEKEPTCPPPGKDAFEKFQRQHRKENCSEDEDDTLFI